MHPLDWFLLILPICFVLGIGIYSHRFMKSVADFMSGGRLAGRYLLAVAKGEMQAGAVVFVATFELISRSGFTLTWWSKIAAPVGIFVALSGFVIYRFRETRAMTLAQFFELRYSRKFRLFSGMLGFLAGILNFGIIPAVGTRFFIHFLHLPESFLVFGLEIPTFVVLMGGFLCVSLTLTLLGGLITMMITDCVEGIISQLFYLIIVLALVMMFSWSEIEAVLGNREPGYSLFNPFDAMKIQDFNVWYTMMSILLSVYGTMAWQNSSAYNSASLTPHEARMGGILGRWREMGKVSVVTLLAVCAVTFLAHPDFAAAAAPAHDAIGRIDDSQIREQMRVPVALSYLLPIGVKGMLCAVLLLGVFGGDSTHLHSWGGILVQDVIVPLRKRTPTPKEHIRLLRMGMAGVGVFAFLFGCLFRQTEYIIMWFQITTAIYVGGAGSVIIGGLYWKRGTTAGAWAAMLTGSVLSVTGIVTRQIVSDFPFNGVQISFGATLIAITVYVVVSLLTCREPYNLERMLHRGRYALDAEGRPQPIVSTKPKQWWKLIAGIGDGFSRGDRWIAGGLSVWTLGWFGVFAVGVIWNIVAPWPESAWSQFWHVAGIGIPIVLTAVTGVWFTWGGVRDIRALFRRLRLEKSNPLDNGIVVGGRNLDEMGKVDGKRKQEGEMVSHRSP